MNPNFEKDDQDIIEKYFRLIDEKDMPSLLDLFTEDCRIYEPFSRDPLFNDNVGKVKTSLKSRSEIESFFQVVMMACDGLKHKIEFICKPIKNNKCLGDTVISTSSSVIPTWLHFIYMKEEIR